MRVPGSLNDAAFPGSTMLVAGGLRVGVSKASLRSARAVVGDQVRPAIVAVNP